jgi:hypothetical protein
MISQQGRRCQASNENRENGGDQACPIWRGGERAAMASQSEASLQRLIIAGIATHQPFGWLGLVQAIA